MTEKKETKKEVAITTAKPIKTAWDAVRDEVFFSVEFAFAAGLSMLGTLLSLGDKHYGVGAYFIAMGLLSGGGAMYSLYNLINTLSKLPGPKPLRQRPVRYSPRFNVQKTSSGGVRLRRLMLNNLSR